MKKSRGLIAVIVVILLIAAACAALYLYNEYLNSHITVKEYTCRSSELPESFDGFKIFVISDLHNAPFSGQIITEISNAQPDVIVFTGDMVQLPDHDLSEAVRIAKTFEGKIPVYAVSGNHEQQSEAFWNIYDSFQYSGGVHWLEDESVTIKRYDDAITLIGLADPMHNTLGAEDYELACQKIAENTENSAAFSVLLNHRATMYSAIKDTDVDLILSGHLHGGIIQLPFVGRMIGEHGTVEFPEDVYGEVKHGNGAEMIVSGGCDQNPQKKRWFNQPEVLVIRLKRE